MRGTVVVLLLVELDVVTLVVGDEDFGIAVQIAMVNSEAVVVVDFDRMEMDIVKEQG